MFLPALRRCPTPPITRNAERNRTSHACDWCRRSKAKCTGGQPCQKCSHEGKDCFYGDGKRAKERKNLERTTKQNEYLRDHAEQLRDALRGLIERLSLSQSEQIKVSQLLAESPSTLSDGEDDELPSTEPQQYFHSEVGSAGSPDAMEVDVEWIQQAKREVNCGLPWLNSDPDHFTPVNWSSNDSWIYQIPALQTAERLIDSYFINVHPDFPIVGKDEFMQRFHHYLDNPGPGLSKADRMALCQINCVFAISLTFLSTSHENNDENDHPDHLIYYHRAKALGLELQQEYAETTLEYICALGLLGLYLLSNAYVNRAWNMVGLAIRNATALGLHRQSDANQLSNPKEGLRFRIWWSLFSLERLLNQITGRLSCISHHDMSIPYLVDGSEDKIESKNRGPSCKRRRITATTGKGYFAKSRKNFEICELHMPAAPSSQSSNVSPLFIHRMGLSVITHYFLNRLFSPTKSWNENEIQDTMREIDPRLKSWKSNLPAELNFPLYGDVAENGYQYQKKALAIMFHSARVILYRPCFRWSGRIKNESLASQKFRRDSITKCVGSARALLATIRKPARTGKLHLIRPWWELLYHLCQAADVLMLEITCGSCYTGDEVLEVFQEAKDAVHWLRCMSRRSVHAYRAWEAQDGALRVVARKINGDISDMAVEAETPPDLCPTLVQSPSSPFDAEMMPDFDFAHSEHKRQNLWVQHESFQPLVTVSPLDLEAHRFIPKAFSDQAQDFESLCWPGVADSYGTFDAPGFPWIDPEFEMQDVEHVGSCLPYSSGLYSEEMVQANHNHGCSAHS